VTCSSLDLVPVPPDNSLSAPEDSLALVTSVIKRLVSDLDDDDSAYDSRLRFKESSESGEFGDDDTSLVSLSDNAWMISYYSSPADDSDDKNIGDNYVGAPLDSQLTWVNSPVSDSTSLTSEGDGPGFPSAITLAPIRKHGNRHFGISGIPEKPFLPQGEDPSPRLLITPPVSGSLSPTLLNGGSDDLDLQLFSSTDLELQQTFQVLSLPEASSVPLSMHGAVDFDGRHYQRRQVLSKHSLRSRAKRLSGLQFLLRLPKIVSLCKDDAPASMNTWRRLSHFIRKP